MGYSFVEPVSTLAELTQFIADNRDAVTGEVDRSIIVASCRSENGTEIEDLSALENVTKIRGDLIILDCPSLKSFKGTEKLMNISKSLYLQTNSALKDTSSLSSLAASAPENS